MSTPTPRPALRKAADAHIHPAAPGHSPRGLRQAADADEPATPEPTALDAAAASAVAGAAEDASGAGHRLSGPLGGNTSDSVRPRKGGGGRHRAAAAKPEKTVELTVKVPKSLRREFREAARATKKDPDDVVTALLRAWLDT